MARSIWLQQYREFQSSCTVLTAMDVHLEGLKLLQLHGVTVIE